MTSPGNTFPACENTCPAALITAMAIGILNDTLVAEQQAELERAAWTDLRPWYDVVVVGGGSAGTVLASRLSEEPSLSVLLLESGGEEPATVASYGSWYLFSHETSMNWKYHSVPHPTSCAGAPEGCLMKAGRGLGGSSAINGMQYVRALPQDLDDWATKDGLQGWSYREVLPYFIKSERNSMTVPSGNLEVDKHGTKGPLDVTHFPRRDPLADFLVEAMNDLGIPYRDPCAEEPAPGVSVFQSTINAKGQRRSANLAFLQPARRRPNLDVLTHAHAMKVLFDVGNRATGVQFRGLDGVVRRVNALREVVLSAGAIRTPQLLMLSGIGPREHLQELGIPVRLNLPVGEGLQDMPVMVSPVRFLLPPELQQPATLERIVRDLTEREHQGPMASDTTRRFMGLFNALAPIDSSTPNIQLRFRTVAKTPEGCPNTSGLEDMYYDEYMDAVLVLMGSPSRGTVRLNGTDARTPPLIHPNYFASEGDLEAAAAAMNYVSTMSETTTFRSLGITLDTTNAVAPACTQEFGSDEYWRCVAVQSTSSSGHYTSTCPMGPPGGEFTVLDSRLRVRGARGLRVVDASAMPRGPRASPYVTTLMVAEKGADMIKRDLLPLGLVGEDSALLGESPRG